MAERPVLPVTFGVDGGARGIGNIGCIETLADGGHSGFHFRVKAGGGGSKHGGAEGAGLFGSMDPDRPVHDVRHHLHDKWRLFGYAAEADEAFYGYAFAD